MDSMIRVRRQMESADEDRHGAMQGEWVGTPEIVK